MEIKLTAGEQAAITKAATELAEAKGISQDEAIKALLFMGMGAWGEQQLQQLRRANRRA